MFSRTTMASSIRMPIASERPSSDIVLSVKPNAQTAMNDGEHRDRQREAGDDRRAPRVEEQEDDEHGEQRALDAAPPPRLRTESRDARARRRARPRASTPGGSVCLQRRRRARWIAVADVGGAVALRLHDVDADRLAAVEQRRASAAPRCRRCTVGDLAEPDQLRRRAAATTSCANSSGVSRRPSSRIERSSSVPVDAADRRGEVLRAGAPARPASTPTPAACSACGSSSTVSSRSIAADDAAPPRRPGSTRSSPRDRLDRRAA